MKKKLNEYFKINLNKITTQLILGISSIVFISTLIIGIIFLSQYKILSLKQAEVELTAKSEELAELGNIMLTSPIALPRERIFSTIKNITDANFWILSNNGTVVLSTTNLNIVYQADSLNTKYFDKILNKDNIITYDYSKYFKTKTLTVVTPIVEGNRLIGIIVMHKDVNLIYNSITSFKILIFISIIISISLSVLLGILYSRHFTRPIKSLTEVTKKIAGRDYSVKTNIDREDEIGELAINIDQMTTEISKNIEEIKELEKRAKELVANVSHEFKTPLTLIRGYVENLQDKTTKPSKEVYEKVINNTKILEKLVNELLDLSKFQSGTVILKKEPLDLKQLTEDVISDMKNLGKEKKIKIKLVEEYKDKQIIEADYIKIRQLLTIFLDNSIKYSNEGSNIVITISKEKISIKDTGIGIDKSKLEQLFERYYQVNGSEKGYGLGLCIAKYIADAHGYKIDIDSTEGKGTTVEIIF